MSFVNSRDNETDEIFTRIYKIPDGKPENKFAFDGEYQNAEFANKIIAETHEYWRQLVGNKYYLIN